MQIPKYFYFRIKTDRKGLTVEVEDASDVDVAEVVRCRACIHWSDGGVDEAGRKLYPYCHLNDDQRKSNDYCSYGERKGGDGE